MSEVQASEAYLVGVDRLSHLTDGRNPVGARQFENNISAHTRLPFWQECPPQPLSQSGCST